MASSIFQTSIYSSTSFINFVRSSNIFLSVGSLLKFVLTLNIPPIIHGFIVHAIFFLMYIQINRTINFLQGLSVYHLKLAFVLLSEEL